MNHTNSIGTQQFPGMEEAVAASNVAKPVRAGADGVSVSNQGAIGLSLDEATLSSSANLVGQALSGSDVRPERIAALRQSIEAGTYSVSSSDVAASVLRALAK